MSHPIVSLVVACDVSILEGRLKDLRAYANAMKETILQLPADFTEIVGWCPECELPLNNCTMCSDCGEHGDHWTGCSKHWSQTVADDGCSS